MLKPPLILTLGIEDSAAAYFNSLRKKYFPPERNFIDAHLTLFHALPNEPSVFETVRKLNQPTFTLLISGLVSIGNGVAFKIESPELIKMHKTLQSQWLNRLTAQDSQKIWPHITIQNKVPATEAASVLKELKNDFEPFSCKATRLQLWEYLNGPWRFLEEFALI